MQWSKFRDKKTLDMNRDAERHKTERFAAMRHSPKRKFHKNSPKTRVIGKICATAHIPNGKNYFKSSWMRTLTRITVISYKLIDRLFVVMHHLIRPKSSSSSSSSYSFIRGCHTQPITETCLQGKVVNVRWHGSTMRTTEKVWYGILEFNVPLNTV